MTDAASDVTVAGTLRTLDDKDTRQNNPASSRYTPAHGKR